MIDGNVSEPLRCLLEFEGQKHALPISYQRVDFRSLQIEESFRAELVVLVHCDDCPESFCLPVGKEMLAVRASVYSVPPGEAVGPIIGGEIVPLAHFHGRHVLIPFDIEALESSQNTINRIFDQGVVLALNRAADNIRAYDYTDEKAMFARIKTRALDFSARRMQTDIMDNDFTITAKTNEVAELVRKNMELRDAMEAIKIVGAKRKEENAIREFKELLRLQPAPYRSIAFDEETLTAETNSIEIVHENCDYELGRFQIAIDFDADKMTITNQEPDRIVDGYHHPHISSPDSPCWGNVGLSVAKLLARKAYPALLILVLQFLQSYNADDPYLRIEKWDPDWVDDDDEYEACYENSGTQECLDCGRDGCPWWDDRYDRCREFADLEKCLDCKACDEVDSQIDNCREDKEPCECVDCSLRGCHWAGNEKACHESHNGEHCAGCDQTDCEFYFEEENEDDHIEDSPAVP